MVKIGSAVSMGDPISETITPDNRQTLIQTIGGVVVQDMGRYPKGDVTSWELQFDKANWQLVSQYADNRQSVTIEDSNGETYTARINIKSYSYVERFRNAAVTAQMELWRV